MAFWVFVIGSAIGSFLNVVIYRLPRGQNLSHPGSRCPRCGHAIRWYHNLPIVGWLLLRGKCYDCNQPISLRYPLVEFVVAAMFVTLAYLDAYAPNVQAETSALSGNSVLAFVVHACLGCILLATALIRFDKQSVPWRLPIVAAVVAGASAPFLDRWQCWASLITAVAIFIVTLSGVRRR
jgi:leader peptidase (prepilin peptidase)/N-methyltransferase